MASEEDIVSELILGLHKKADSLLKKGYGDQEIIQQLTLDGIDRDYAELILENVKNDKFDRKEFRKHVLMGSFMVAGSLFVNWMSYKSAMERGSGSYLIIWGVLVAGIVVIIRGIILFRK